MPFKSLMASTTAGSRFISPHAMGAASLYGEMQLALIPKAPSSLAADRTRPSSPCFDTV
ncbi:hypothetical protein CDL15_Pgr020118 [Punica granatum]|uniref:Uncharacterized protein n=1 Tax=Punica granatum TaxID=22663 RepID=A0A218VQL6_PUNGR|nr:hypothetical protein CDL15_Pgr020118 [Punica granatum]